MTSQSLDESREQIGANPLTLDQVKTQFPDCVVQKSTSHGSTSSILKISDGISQRVYLRVSEDRYLPFTRNGDDVSDLVSGIFANYSVKFKNAHSVEFNPQTAELKVIDGKLIGPQYTESFVKVYTLGGEYIERMILKDGVLSRARLNGNEVILHDAGGGGATNSIQFPGVAKPSGFEGELIINEQGDIEIREGMIYSHKLGLTRQWQVTEKGLKLVGTRCINEDGKILPITLFGKDISSKIELNKSGTECTLRSTANNFRENPIVNNETGEVLTYGDYIVTEASGHTQIGQTDIGICRSLDGGKHGVVLYNTETFQIREITLDGENVSNELIFVWNRSQYLEYHGEKYSLDYQSGTLYKSRDQVINPTGEKREVTFLGKTKPKGSKIVRPGILSTQIAGSDVLVAYNQNTGEVLYKQDSDGKIYLTLIDHSFVESFNKVVFYNPSTDKMVEIFDPDLLSHIDALPYASTQGIINDTKVAVKDRLSAS